MFPPAASKVSRSRANLCCWATAENGMGGREGKQYQSADLEPGGETGCCRYSKEHTDVCTMSLFFDKYLFFDFVDLWHFTTSYPTSMCTHTENSDILKTPFLELKMLLLQGASWSCLSRPYPSLVHSLSTTCGFTVLHLALYFLILFS